MLTFHEKKLAKMRISGMSLIEISAATGRAYGTVRNDFSKIQKKLGISELRGNVLSRAVEEGTVSHKNEFAQ